MSVNTFVWGFHRQLIKVIEVLQENQSITPKCWIARLWYSQHEQMKKYNNLDRETFYSWDWTRKYKTELEKYTHAVEFNQKVYDKVYEKLWLFVDHCSRLDRKWTQRSIHYYLNHFNLLYHFFYSIFVKEQIQLVLIHHPHHLGIDTIIYEIAKALNIKTIIVTQSLTPNKFFYIDDIDDYGNFHFMTKQEDVSDVKLE